MILKTNLSFLLRSQCWSRIKLFLFCVLPQYDDTTSKIRIAIHLARFARQQKWQPSCGDTFGQAPITIQMARFVWRYNWQGSHSYADGKDCLAIHLVEFVWLCRWQTCRGFVRRPGRMYRQQSSQRETRSAHLW